MMMLRPPTGTKDPFLDALEALRLERLDCLLASERRVDGCLVYDIDAARPPKARHDRHMIRGPSDAEA
jgi:hypothetical protein